MDAPEGHLELMNDPAPLQSARLAWVNFECPVAAFAQWLICAWVGAFEVAAAPIPPVAIVSVIPTSPNPKILITRFRMVPPSILDVPPCLVRSGWCANGSPCAPETVRAVARCPTLGRSPLVEHGPATVLRAGAPTGRP